jgi:predicted Zn-dependent peptidase
MEGFDSSSCLGFSKRAISPKRGVLVVVGPTPFDAVKRAATQQLGTWRKRSDDNLATIQEEPRRGARQAELHLAAAQAGLAMAYSMPQLGSDQEALASLAIHMLLSPEYGLLRQTNRPYKNVRGNVINSRDAAALLLFVDADTGTDARTLGSQVETDIALRFQDLTAGDFKHAQSDQSRRLWRARLDPHELATRLGEACLLGQGPASVLNLAERVAALNIDALKSFAKKTFDPMQRSTVLLTPSQLADEQTWPETFVHCLQYRWPPPAQQEVP